MNWQATKGENPPTTLRHELAHSMQFQLLAGRGVSAPAWLAEGSSRLEQFTVPGTQYSAMYTRYTAFSMATVGTAIAFSDLQSGADWVTRAQHGGGAEYEEAAMIFQMLRDDAGMAGWLHTFELMGEGQSVDAALTSVLARPLGVFADGVASRLAALAPSAPGAYAAQDTNGDPNGLRFGAYAFKPATSVNWTITQPDGAVRNFTGTATADGMQTQGLASGYPSGTYRATVTGTSVSGKNVSVTVSGVKRSGP